MAKKLPPLPPNTPLRAKTEEKDSNRVRNYSTYWCAAFAANTLIMHVFGSPKELLLPGIAVCFGLLAWVIHCMPHASRLLLWSCAACCIGISLVLCLVWPVVPPILVMILVSAEITTAFNLRKKF
ncbi:MAG: hypothetical protein IIY16_07720 [Oscillospiraceae bacterium]|nr:hypothetical protein [Oscillospiraceae bacterium]